MTTGEIVTNVSDISSGPFLSKGILQAILTTWNRVGGQSIIPIGGPGMSPLLQTGDQVLVAHGYDDIQAGDIIVFWDDNALIVHRVLRIENTPTGPHFLTKGDNTDHFNRPIPPNQVIGRVLSVKRGQRYLTMDTIK